MTERYEYIKLFFYSFIITVLLISIIIVLYLNTQEDISLDNFIVFIKNCLK